MEIIFYLNKSENNRMSKNVVELFSMQGNFRNSVDIINPTFDIIDDGSNIIQNANYCFVPEFHRYYFIRKVTSYRTNVFTVECSIDVLMTYRSEILEMYAVINADQNNQYYNGNGGDYDVRKEREIIYLENNFNPDGTFVLTGINANSII